MIMPWKVQTPLKFKLTVQNLYTEVQANRENLYTEFIPSDRRDYSIIIIDCLHRVCSRTSSS